MRTVDLNFASTPFRNNTPYYLGYGFLTLFVAAFTLYNGYAYIAYGKNQALLESDYAQKKARLEGFYEVSGRLQAEIAKKDVGAINERASFTNKLLDTRRFSWTALLNDLEEAQPYQVRLLSLRPIIQTRGILIEARAVAKDLKAFWNFQQNLQNHPRFRRVYPGGYLRNSDAGEFIFNIAFNYFPEGAPPGLEGLSPEAVAKEGIVEAPGAYQGGADVEEEEEVAEAPPEAAEPAGKNPRSTLQAGVGLSRAPGRRAGQSPGADSSPALPAEDLRELQGASPAQASGVVIPPAGSLPRGVPFGRLPLTPGSAPQPIAPKKPRYPGRGGIPGMEGKEPPPDPTQVDKKQPPKLPLGAKEPAPGEGDNTAEDNP